MVNHKRVYRIMKENQLLCDKFHRKSRAYSSYQGTVGQVADNKLKREFDVKQPNQVWVTDITEFKVLNTKLYLSSILDLYNSEIIAYTLARRPTIELTNESLIRALKILPKQHNLLIHSDQGMHYQHLSWVNLLKKHQIEQSMSRKGNCLDNAPIENFFGLLKQEMYYGQKFKSIRELEKEIDSYIYWYNHLRIKTKLKGLSPIQYRQESSVLNV